MTFATLRTLHAVIGAALDEMEHTYRQQAPSLDYPSHDTPYYPSEKHTPEEELVEALKSDPVVAAASMRIVAACEQLSTTVHKPYFGLSKDIQAGDFAECVRFLEMANIVEILREAGPAGLHVEEIHKLVLDLCPQGESVAPSPLKVSNLTHILRLLATAHYLREVKPNSVADIRKANDRNFKYKDTDGVAAYLNMTGDDVQKNSGGLTDWAFPDLLPAGNLEFVGAVRPASEPSEKITTAKVKSYHAPLNLVWDTTRKYFEWLELPQNTRRLKRFGPAMIGTRQWEPKGGILKGFDWKDLPQDSVLVDVGGGIGATAIVVADAHPHIRVVVEDRPQVVAAAQAEWEPQYTHLFESGRMSYRPCDFFEPFEPLNIAGVGPVASPAVFLVRLVMHNWQDGPAREILSRLRKVANASSKLLISEMLLPYACADDKDGTSGDGADKIQTAFPFVGAETCLLPNLGVANIHGYLVDISMMATFDTKVRTPDEMSALALSAGWKVTEIRREPGSLWAYAAAVPV